MSETPPPRVAAVSDRPSSAMSTMKIVGLIAALSMLQPLATDLYLPTLPGIARYFSADAGAVQWTLSVFIGAFGIWQLVAGPLSDRYGRRVPIIVGAFVYFIASSLCAVAPSLGVLIAARALQAIGACTCLVAARGLIRDLYAPSEGARVLATAATLMSLAPMVGPIVGAYLEVSFGWRSAFVVIACFSLGVAIAALGSLAETHQRRDAHVLKPAPMFRNYLRIARSRAFSAYALTAASTYAGLFAYLSGSSFVLIGVLGLSTTTFSFAFATMVIGYLLGTLICRRLVLREGLQTTIAAGAILQVCAGAVLVLLALVGLHKPWAIVVPMFFFGISHGILQSPAQAGAVAPFPGSAGSAAALLGFGMMLTAAAVGIWIGASFNGTVYPLTLTIGAISALTCTVAMTRVRRHGDVSHHG